MMLERVNQIGYAYFDHFDMDDGSVKEVQTTAEAYAALALPNPVNPTIKNGTWRFSYETPKFDSIDGKLGNGQCASFINHYVKLAGCHQTTVKNEDMVGNNLDDNLVSKILITQKEPTIM